MDFGKINANGYLAKELAKVLGTSTQALDGIDGKRDNKIDVKKVQERYAGRIASLPLSGRSCCNVPALMIVDNGNGVIDGEDVFIAQQETTRGYDSWGGPFVGFHSGYEDDQGKRVHEAHPLIEKYRELLPKIFVRGTMRFAQLNDKNIGQALEAVNPGRDCMCGSHL